MCPEAVGGNEAGEHSCETAEGSNEQAGPSNDIGLLNQKKRIDDKKFNKTGAGNREASFKGTR